ncbi:RING/U-box superfamily protein [Rhynchospora pubera]|uniref:RING-type E3 ubiquitin transferase n=1 Tax=Rhynchospora pubera TaxID=906938 RepID=A0AAV8G6L2_9POAL|nr:RING/U-box superfamily protein [Rhynchospora pubera]
MKTFPLPSTLLPLLVFLLLGLFRPSASLRPIRDRPSVVTSATWSDENALFKRDEAELNPYYWNITGIYRGTWRFMGPANGSSKFVDSSGFQGVSVLELLSKPSKLQGVHYVTGSITFQDLFDNEREHARLRIEGVYVWPFRQLRMVANSGGDGPFPEEEYFRSNPYHLLGMFSNQVYPDPLKGNNGEKNALTKELEKYCNVEIAAKVSRISASQIEGEHDKYRFEGLTEAPALDSDGECFTPILLNASSINVDVYYNKAVNYTLMVTFISFLQVLLHIRQMEHSNSQFGASKVSLIMIGQQAIMDAYLCLLHLAAGVVVESLFNAFATAAFFKFVVFSIFEMRYFLAIWKATRPASSSENWEVMRRELSVLYSRFYGILVGGILVTYELRVFLRAIVFLAYSFWVPQIVTNIIKDTRKPLHPQYILGMSVTRLAIPLYVFGCPSNFLRIEADKWWCICLTVFVAVQAGILLVQHYFGSRCFIPRQILPEKYCYHRKVESNSQATDCVICMASIDLSRRYDYMVTPCEHLFHSGCLQRWMDIKMECPTCRRSLPPA